MFCVKQELAKWVLKQLNLPGWMDDLLYVGPKHPVEASPLTSIFSKQIFSVGTETSMSCLVKNYEKLNRLQGRSHKNYATFQEIRELKKLGSIRITTEEWRYNLIKYLGFAHQKTPLCEAKPTQIPQSRQFGET